MVMCFMVLEKTRLAVDKVKPCTGDGVGVVMQKKSIVGTRTLEFT